MAKITILSYFLLWFLYCLLSFRIFFKILQKEKVKEPQLGDN